MRRQSRVVIEPLSLVNVCSVLVMSGSFAKTRSKQAVFDPVISSLVIYSNYIKVALKPFLLVLASRVEAPLHFTSHSPLEALHCESM